MLANLSIKIVKLEILLETDENFTSPTANPTTKSNILEVVEVVSKELDGLPEISRNTKSNKEEDEELLLL